MRFLVIDRQTGDAAVDVDADAFFTFHSVNAFEDGRRAGGGPGGLRGLVDHRRPLPGQPARPQGVPWPPASCAATGCRWTAARRSARTSATSRSSCRGSTTARATGATTATSTAPASAVADFVDQLVKVDLETARGELWQRARLLSGRAGVRGPRRAPRARTTACSCRWCWTPRRERSFLLVLDARDFAEIARAEAPHHIPFGFHGDFRREVSIDHVRLFRYRPTSSGVGEPRARPGWTTTCAPRRPSATRVVESLRRPRGRGPAGGATSSRTASSARWELGRAASSRRWRPTCRAAGAARRREPAR